MGKSFRGDELPEELAWREGRLKKIRRAKAELKKEAVFGQIKEQRGFRRRKTA
ncbi:MAG: hypothetical protein ACYCO5_03555 [Acidobacteriaceae bacterium]